MNTIRLTAAQALVRYLSAQVNEDGQRFVAGVWAIFGHGNVAGLGEALYQAGDALPTWRGHNEQGMAPCGHRLRQGQQPEAGHGGDILHRPRRPPTWSRPLHWRT